MGALTPVLMSGLPLKRAMSTCLSQATTMALARAISAAVGLFLTPMEPLVSTFTSKPSSLAARSRDSAAR
ncbi:hypothetical protein D3C71_1528540 [compost metagenome]